MKLRFSQCVLIISIAKVRTASFSRHCHFIAHIATRVGTSVPLTSSTEDLRVERERQRSLVFALPRTEPTADCLWSMASNLLDHKFRLEDAVLAAAADAPPAAERLVILLASLRAVLPEATAMFGQSYAATHYGCHAAGNALHVDEDVPGLTAAQMKAIRAASVAEEQARAARAAQPVAARNNTAGHRHSIQLASARATAAAMEAAPEPEPPAPAVPAGPTRPAAPAWPFDARQVYRCNSCNILGHWSQDNKCKPADVQANLARLSALLAPPPVAASEPVASPSTGKTEF